MAEWSFTTQGSPPRRIDIKIDGEIQIDDAKGAAERLARILGRTPESVAVVIDMRSLRGYPVSARDHWSDMMKAHRPKFRMVVWITAKTTYRMVARAVGLFTGIPTLVVDDPQQIDEAKLYAH